MDKKIYFFFVLLFAFSMIIYGKSELTGPITKEEILEHSPDWQEVIDSYTPNQDIISELKSIHNEIKIEVFVGTWCPDSKRNVSAYIKIMELVNNSFLTTSYIGLPRDKDSRQPFIQGKNIIRIPTFIVYVKNQEKGRIVENPLKSVEEDLLDIIKSK